MKLKLFDKKVEIYCSKGKKEEWQEVEDGFEKAGLRTWPAIHSEEVRSVPPCCSLEKAKAGFDTNIYEIRVHESDREKAEEILRRMLPRYTPYRGH